MSCAMWCTTCGRRFAGVEVVTATRCPACGAEGVPCDPKHDLLIEINWHELRILGIWASNWAANHCKDDDGTQRVIRGILSRLERQAPGLPPLTMGGELREVRDYLAKHGGELVGHNLPPEGMVIVNGPGAIGFGRKPGEAPDV